MVGPAVAAHMGVRKTRLMGRELNQGDLVLAVAGEFGNVVGHPVGEGQLALFDQTPDRRHRQHLGVRE